MNLALQKCSQIDWVHFKMKQGLAICRGVQRKMRIGCLLFHPPVACLPEQGRESCGGFEEEAGRSGEAKNENGRRKKIKTEIC